MDEIEDGKFVIVIVDDITNIKLLEQESIRIRSMFFSSVAHELRTPLNSIIPMSKSLKKYVNDPHGLRILDTIINGSIHLSLVIEDALDMTRIENNKFQINLDSFNIIETVNDVLDIMKFPA
jgi:signal transduction histidine kinase